MKRSRLGISLRDALALDAFEGVEVVAGAGGLDRKIFHINVMEVPDILDWVREGELLFTTLYSLRNDPQEQVALIPKLAEKNLAGLAIKPKRYIEEIPQEAIELADRLDFPILKLPQHIAFSTVMEPLLNEIFDFQTDLLNQSEWTHNKLLEVVLAGGGVEELVKVLADILNANVTIVDRKLTPLTPLLPKMENWLSEADLVTLRTATRLTRINGEKSGLVVPLLASGSLLGYLLATGKDDGGEFTVLDEITLERGATVAALEVINAKAVQEVERRFRNEFVVDLIEGAFPSDEVAKQRARTNDWNLEDRMRVLMVRLADLRVQGQKDRLLAYINSRFGSLCISGEMGRDIILVTPVSAELDIVEWLKDNQKDIEKLIETELVVGIGRDSKTIKGIKFSFREARTALKIAAEVKGLGNFVHYLQLGIYRLLIEVSGKPELEAFVRDNLKPLLDYDRENNTDFIKTLEVYFEASGNLKQVAKQMYVHYNTVLYRIDRIEKLLGVDLSNPQQRLSIEVALKAENLK